MEKKTLLFSIVLLAAVLAHGQDRSTQAGYCTNCAQNGNILGFSSDVLGSFGGQACPIGTQLDSEIREARRSGLSVVSGAEAKWADLDCSFDRDSFYQSGVSGFYCRKSNVIVLREGTSDYDSTKLHEFGHYKNNAQVRAQGEIHPFDEIDVYFEKLNTGSITETQLKRAIEIVLIILWDESTAFQSVVPCQDYPEEVVHDFYMTKLIENYVPRFQGIQVYGSQVKDFYRRVQSSSSLDELLKDDQVKQLANRIFRQSQHLLVRRR